MITLNKSTGANKLNLKVSIVYEQLFFLISGRQKRTTQVQLFAVSKLYLILN